VDAVIELSDEVDCSTDMDGIGILIFWKSMEFKPIIGVRSTLAEGSDEYLDAMNNGTLENYLEFFV
jgi:hypothetical protein